MADISIEQAKAKQWILDVQNELSRVEVVLNNVANACTTVPGDQDDIMEGIIKTGDSLKNFWEEMCGGFKTAAEILKEGIDKLGQTAEEIIEDINTVKSKIGK